MSAAVPHRRLLWRCRRGMKELDVLLERYVAAGFPQAPADEQAAFLRLLELPDPILAAHLLHGLTPADALLAHLVRRIHATSQALAVRAPLRHDL